MSDSSESKISQAEIDDLFRAIGAMTDEELRNRLDGKDEDVKFTIRKNIAQKGLADRLLKTGWITVKQKREIEIMRDLFAQLSQAEIDDLFRAIGGAITHEELQNRLDGKDEDAKFNIRKNIAEKGVAERLLTAKWITPKQKEDIDFVDTTIRNAWWPAPGGGKRRYSTRSKKYKKSNKRSKRTRTLRRKRYSRKS